jgi:hypothetical protein
LILCCFLAFFFGITGVNAQSIIGDANGDGAVNIIDALVIARHYVDSTAAINVSLSDVNCDGAVDIIDALRVAQYYVGLLSSFTCTNPTPAPVLNYVPGDVLVGFYDTVTLEQANNLIQSYNLTWNENFPTTFAVWLEVSNNPEAYIASLTASTIVSWAEVRGYTGGATDKIYIIAQSKVNVTQQAMVTLVNGMSGIRIVEYVVGSKWGVVKVPVGSETTWINLFTAQPIVKYAQLNYLATIN